MTRFTLLAFDPRRNTCRAKMRVEFAQGYDPNRVATREEWYSLRQLRFDLEMHPNDSELKRAIEHYKSGKAYKVSK